MTPLRRWWGVVPVLLLAVLIVPELGFVPIWDGSVYAQCVADAAAKGMNVQSLRCGGHQSQLYMGVLAVAQAAFAQLVTPAKVGAAIAANMALALAALGALASLLRRVFPGEQWWLERALLVTIAAVHPLLAATIVQLNSDFGVYVFFVVALALLVSRRYWPAAAAGLMLCLSKETGALVYAALIALYAALRMSGGNGPIRTRAGSVARELLPSCIPLVLYAGFLVWWAATQSSYAIWNQGMHEHPIAGIRLFDFDDLILRSYAAIIFVLGFAWLPSLVILADFAVGSVRAMRRAPDRALPGVDARLAGFLAALTAVLVYLLTIYRTWSFPRYFALLAPMLLLVAFVSLVRLGAGARMRRLLLGAMVLVMFSANYSSWDPVSRRLFGTLPVGETSLYDVSSIAKDFRVRDADHLCYNLQFTGFHHALDAMFVAMRPGDSTMIVFPRFNRWGLWSPLDGRSFGRVVSGPGAFMPRYADEAIVAAMGAGKPRELWLVEQPNDGDTLAVQKLHRDYTDADSSRFTAHGLTITARHLVRRDVAVLVSGEHR